MKTVNLHTHFLLPDNQTGLVNQSLLLPFEPVAGQSYSLGLHPWDIDQVSGNDWLQQLEELLAHPQVLALGECGIDRSIETPLPIQLDSFLPQLELAEKLQKPVILHAVRSYSDLLQLKKNYAPRSPWILHGYQGNVETTAQLARQGFCFSMGAALLNDRPKLNQALTEIPPAQLFFETDESTVQLESIYIFAADKRKTTVEKLKQQVFENYQRIFGR